MKVKHRQQTARRRMRQVDSWTLSFVLGIAVSAAFAVQLTYPSSRSASIKRRKSNFISQPALLSNSPIPHNLTCLLKPFRYSRPLRGVRIASASSASSPPTQPLISNSSPAECLSRILDWSSPDSYLSVDCAYARSDMHRESRTERERNIAQIQAGRVVTSNLRTLP
jgi:hypothetical protein